MYYAYLIRSLQYQNQTYIGFTKDLRQRLYCRGSRHTARYKPWKLISYFAFESEKKAIEFEKYLKSQAGRAFAKKRIL